MPVIFRTLTSERITMLDKDADFILKAMKTSGNIPGALYAEDVKDALESLQHRLKLESDEVSSEDDDHDDEKSDYVGMHTKAFPIIQLMERAIDQDEKLNWDKG